jgi:hypothetical protein
MSKRTWWDSPPLSFSSTPNVPPQPRCHGLKPPSPFVSGICQYNGKLTTCMCYLGFRVPFKSYAGSVKWDQAPTLPCPAPLPFALCPVLLVTVENITSFSGLSRCGAAHLCVVTQQRLAFVYSLVTASRILKGRSVRKTEDHWSRSLVCFFSFKDHLVYLVNFFF